MMERGKADWTYDREAGAWYLGLKHTAPPPYTTQKHVEAILDLDDQGQLVGVEILETITPSRGAHNGSTSVSHLADAIGEALLGNSAADAMAALSLVSAGIGTMCGAGRDLDFREKFIALFETALRNSFESYDRGDVKVDFEIAQKGDPLGW